MQILVIGATGQIGFALTHALAQTEHTLSVLVRDPGTLAFPSAVRVVRAPRFDAQAFTNALAGVDHVVYALGLPEQFVTDNSIFERVNASLLRQCLEQLPATVTGLTYVSTYEIFEAVDGVIRESHPLADPRTLSPYFRSMLEAYQQVQAAAQARGLRLSTLHPAAVYGGRDTAQGFTHYLENLRQWRFWRVPFIFAGRFPLVHVRSLAGAALRALDVPGHFIVSDQMTSLKEIALTLRQLARSYVPPVAPVAAARLGAAGLEALARVTHRPPLMANVQIDFITKGWEPKADKAIQQLGWQPLPLRQGLQQYLQENSALGA